MTIKMKTSEKISINANDRCIYVMIARCNVRNAEKDRTEDALLV